MDLLSEEEALSLFNGNELSDMMQLLISDCNGHPRSLQRMWETCDEVNWDLDTFGYAAIVKKFVEHYGKLISPPLSVVKAVLLAEEVELDSPPDKERPKKTFQSYIEDGVLINSVGGTPP